jgi:hypothetical protein
MFECGGLGSNEKNKKPKITNSDESETLLSKTLKFLRFKRPRPIIAAEVMVEKVVEETQTKADPGVPDEESFSLAEKMVHRHLHRKRGPWTSLNY